MTWRSTPVLVTGGGGFIGSHLVERLVQEGAEVRALVHYRSTGSAGWLDRSPSLKDVEIVRGDLRDRDLVNGAMRGRHVVFHLGALIAIPYSYDAPASYVDTNVLGTLHVLQAARECGVTRVVHTSTSEVYGTAQRVPIDEQHPLQAQSPYSASKIGADKIAEAFHLSFDLPVVTVRPFNTYGPRQSARAVIPTLITQALTDQPIRLGNVTPTRDFVFVADTVDGFVRAGAARDAVGHTINLGTGREISIADLATTIARLCGTTAHIERDERRVRPGASEVERLCADNRKAASVLGWAPLVTLEQGLQQTIAWLRDHQSLYRPADYAV
ncbi:MAG: GDP-mannose 4,6-dehydratase [Acidobacteria bacterium]|nr:GDP-mannose 4,6-dehydratase [Acidobacteriota bacterium]